MHNLFSGLMGFFLSMGAMFHGGAAVNSSINHPQPTQQANTTSTPSGMMNRGYGFGHEKNLSNGERPFFGTVTNINGSTLTIQMQGRMGMMNPSITPPQPKTLTINLNSSTTYSDGSQSDINTNTKIAGVGKVNSDGSISAVSVQINPTSPSGFPIRGDISGIPSGSKPFFGQVSTLSGTTLTIQGQGRMMGNGQTTTVDLTASTQYKGGSQSEIKSGARIAGYGTANSDGSINAQQIMIIPMMPNRGQFEGQGKDQ